MDHRGAMMERKKRIALVAHDNKKQELLEWARSNEQMLAQHELYATGTTGRMLTLELGIPVTRLRSGPMGGDMQIGAQIANGDIDLLVFFWDPLTAQPHDPDVKALLRIAVVWNVPLACDRASADFMISSPLMSEEYRRQLLDTEDYAVPELLRPGLYLRISVLSDFATEEAQAHLAETGHRLSSSEPLTEHPREAERVDVASDSLPPTISED